jgi:hypothetical protein
MYFTAVNENDSPYDSYTPLITGRGMSLNMSPIRPVTPRPNRVPAVQIPAAIISTMVRCFPSMIVTAAMAFMVEPAWELGKTGL